MRADRSQPSRTGHAAAGDGQPGRHPAQHAAGHGTLPGRLLHLPRHGHPARALEGRMADPVRGSAAPSAARRLDLPRTSRRRAPPRRRGPGVSHHDVIVVGIGLAGLTAAVRLAEGGARVLVLAKGVGATHLGPCTIDVLGYAPDRVEKPGEALAALADDHPYSLVGRDGVAAALDWLGERLPYVGGLDENLLLPTAVGALKPSAAVQTSMAAGDLRTGAEVVVVGFRALKDFHAHLLADNLTRSGLSARSVELDLVP